MTLPTSRQNERAAVVELLEQEPGVFKGNRRGPGKLTMSFERIAEERSGFYRHAFVTGCGLQQTKGAKDAREARRFEMKLRVAREKGELARSLAATPPYRRSRRVNFIGLAKTADAIVGESRAGFDRARAGLVPDHPQGEVVTLPLAEISIVADVHGHSLSLFRFECVATSCREHVEIVHSVREIDRNAKPELQVALRSR